MAAANLKVLLVVALVPSVFLLPGNSAPRLPGDHRGYTPEQPIHFSHRLHAGELAIDCRYCHFGAWESRHAGIPPASVCMNCHTSVSAGFDALLAEREAAAAEKREPRRVVSPEIAKLYAALGLDDALTRVAEPKAIPWVRVHDLPDFTWFDHRVHVARAIACETCHGPVQSMERIRQESSLSMGWCLDCHRSNAAQPGGEPAQHVSTDCSACHF
jgi:hypothetical protein